MHRGVLDRTDEERKEAPVTDERVISDVGEAVRALQYQAYGWGPRRDVLVTDEVLAEIEEEYGPLGWARPFWEHLDEVFAGWDKLAGEVALPPKVPPQLGGSEEERVLRDLVPLVRAATDDGYRSAPDLPCRRPPLQQGHTYDADCPCGSWQWGGDVVHHDTNSDTITFSDATGLSLGHGYAFERSTAEVDRG